MKEKIIFISHDATLTGAPILLLNILRSLRSLLEEEFIVVLGQDGPLRPQLEEIAQVVVYPAMLASGYFAGGLRRLSLLNAYNKRQYQQGLAFGNVKAIFSNTIVNGELVEKIAALNKAPVITYVHELNYSTQLFGANLVSKSLSQTTLFLAGSAAVQRHLRSLGVEADRLELIPSSVPAEALEKKLAAIDIPEVRAFLKLQAHEKLVVAVGTADWRKGNDLFMQVAALLARAQFQAQFVWVGVSPGTTEHIRMSYEIAQFGLEGRFHLIPVTPDYLKYIAAADVFILSSREDPFPLVVLEAALAGKPVVCFDKAGGAADFVSHTHGVVVPYGDVAALASATASLLTNSEQAQALGRAGHQAVRAEYNTPTAAVRIKQAIVQLT